MMMMMTGADGIQQLYSLFVSNVGPAMPILMFLFISFNTTNTSATLGKTNTYANTDWRSPVAFPVVVPYTDNKRMNS